MPQRGNVMSEDGTSQPSGGPQAVAGRCIPKLIGSDVELGNSILGREDLFGTGADAARLLLQRIDGFPKRHRYRDDRDGPSYAMAYGGAAPSSDGYGGHQDTRSYGRWSAAGLRQFVQPDGRHSPQDWGRKYLSTNGGCVYIDLDHLELCTPEVVSAREFVAASRAMLLIARDAMHAVNERLPEGERMVLLANNSDGRGNSYGSHLNFLITRRAWKRLFERIDLFVLASYQASSIVFAGQGKVGAENGRSAVDYQISQRADFIETLLGLQTTWQRPLVNSRDEALCGRPRYDRENGPVDGPFSRLHCIFYDHTLCHVSTFLKVGGMQLILAMIEADCSPSDLVLEDPASAVHTWSHDPDLGARARLANGKAVTAVELQRMFFERAAAFAQTTTCSERVVPGAAAVVALWDDTLAKLAARDFEALAPRLDWVLKRSLLERALHERPDLDWGSSEIKHLDLMYSSLDEHDGLYWACERSMLVERIVTDAEIERFVHEPPENTRAWTRAMLLRVGGDRVDDVNWDEITFDCSKAGEWPRLRTAMLADPLASTRAEWEPHLAEAASFEDLLDRLDLTRPNANRALIRHTGGEADQKTASEENQMEDEA